ncbi:MAG TPA: 50S ribosomal protein L5 [Candidatus Vogelbacteria bacterium]|nr:50S ribosomal protein L5 [Candidatus Vogelbacteria bacterium]
MKTISIKEKIKLIEKDLMKDLGLNNVNSLPKIEKVVVSVGTGRGRDTKKNELVIEKLKKITGQKPVGCQAKKSIATFKLRQGEIIGQKVTLRGSKMYDFIDRLLNIALPRTRDFKGLSLKNIDNMGNLTIGIKENIVFPETADEDIKDVFGLAITIITTAKNKATAELLFKKLNFPFK